jgi:hypothetical protein
MKIRPITGSDGPSSLEDEPYEWDDEYECDDDDEWEYECDGDEW